MSKFTKAEMMDEFKEIVYQYARGACFCLDEEAGYRMLFGRSPGNTNDLFHFMSPDVDSRTYDEPFSINHFQVTKSIEQFYDYGLLGIRNMPQVESGGANDWTFAYGLIWDTSRSVLISESCNGESVDARKCLYAAKAFFARLILDGSERTYIDSDESVPSDMLSISEVAILAGLDERTVRNATSKSAANRIETAIVDSNIFIPREAALAWLITKRGFTPTRIGEELPAQAVLNDSFSGTQEAGDYVRKVRERLNLSPKALLERANVTMDAASLNQIEEGDFPSDERSLTAIGNALGLNGVLFALRLIEAKQKYEAHELQRRITKAANS
jgi:hypothetical protein